MSRSRLDLAAAVIGAAVLLTSLSGCAPGAGGTGTPSATPSASGGAIGATNTAAATATATPSADPGAAPLACADLLSDADASVALAPPGQAAAAAAAAAAVDPLSVETFSPVLAALPALGGLSCEWAAPAAADGSAVQRLEVSVLPGSAGEDAGCLPLGDDPCGEAGEHWTVRSFGGVDAWTGCGDPGCVASALVGDRWVTVEVHDPGMSGAGGVLGGPDEIWAAVTPAISTLVAVVAAAPAGGFASSTTATPPPAARGCDDYLPLGDAAAVLGDESVRWGAATASVAGSRTLAEAAVDRAGFVECDVVTTVNGFETRAFGFTAMPGLAQVLTGFTTATAARDDAPTALAPTSLPGLTASESAFAFVGAGVPRLVLFSLGTDAFLTEGDIAGQDAGTAAEAIIAHRG